MNKQIEVRQTALTEGAAFERLVAIMNDLRTQCPWDKKQTVQTLRTLTIEEMYELADAILKEDWKDIKEEIGDVLLHMVFYATIAKEGNYFTITDALNSICEKLIRRHPHIYADTVVHREEDVKKNWEKIKQKEEKKTLLSGVPNSLPAMVKATRIQEKAKQVGFEWEHKNDVWNKVQEELNELQAAEVSGNFNAIEEEFGDVMFSLVNYARFIGVDAETALERTNRKFKSRFEAMELLAAQQGLNLYNMSLADMDALWNEVKKSC
ncbi:MAG: nucleoside triphosphate pyrophosphohydrolase [Chitinophagaceae bacterium]